MDLLGRKSKAALEKAVNERNEIIQIASTQREVIADLSSRCYSRETLIQDLLREGELLRAKVAMLEHLLDNPPAPRRPQHVSEEKQELEWQLEHKLIDLGEYEHLLQELDYQNAEIELDPDYRPRPDLTY